MYKVHCKPIYVYLYAYEVVTTTIKQVDRWKWKCCCRLSSIQWDAVQPPTSACCNFHFNIIYIFNGLFLHTQHTRTHIFRLAHLLCNLTRSQFSQLTFTQFSLSTIFIYFFIVVNEILCSWENPSLLALLALNAYLLSFVAILLNTCCEYCHLNFISVRRCLMSPLYLAISRYVGMYVCMGSCMVLSERHLLCNLHAYKVKLDNLCRQCSRLACLRRGNL